MYRQWPRECRHPWCWRAQDVVDSGLQIGCRIHHVCCRKRTEQEWLVLGRVDAELGWHFAASLSSDLFVSISEWCNSTTQLHASSCTLPAHAYDNAPVFVLPRANTSMRLASAFCLLESSVRTFASTPLLERSGLDSIATIPPVR